MPYRRFRSYGLLFAVVFGSFASSSADEPPPLRGPRAHAVTGARVIVSPGTSLEGAILVVRDGLVEAIGPDLSIPADARVWDHSGKTIYPGLIESYLAVPWPPQDDTLSTDGPLNQGMSPDPRIHPERDASRLTLPPEGLESLRKAGFTTALVAPADGVFRGSGALLNLGSGGSRGNLLQANLSQHLALEPRGRGEEGYGLSKMGVTSLVRQTFLDVHWYAESHQSWRRDLGTAKATERPPFDRALETLFDAANGDQLVLFETEDLLDTLRAARLAQELELQAAVVGTGWEYQGLGQLEALGLPILLPLRFPEAPKVPKEGDDLTVGLEELRHWDAAPDNAASLLEAGLTVALTGHLLNDPSDLFGAVARALERGLTEDQALAALTTTPAAILQVEGLTGRLEVGTMANFFVVDGPLWTKNPKILEVWIDGRRYPIAKPSPDEDQDPVGSWDLRLLLGDAAGQRLLLQLTEGTAGLSGTTTAPDSHEARSASAEPATVPLDSASFSEGTLEVAFDGRQLDLEGTVTLRLELRGDQVKGLGQGPDGEFAVQGNRTQASPLNEKISADPSLEQLLEELESVPDLGPDLVPEAMPDGPPRELQP